MATLYVVATPIGNLEDITPRANRILGEVTIIAAESVNRTRKLLAHLGLSGKKIFSCREANRKRAAEQVARALDQGFDVALVSDAGTPGISDPGGYVVEFIAQKGFKISPIPGACALAAGLSVSGLASAPVTFLGFLPTKMGARKKILEKAKDTGWPFVLYEAPHRLKATANDLNDIFGSRPVVLAREITKIHEEIVHTTCSELAQKAKQVAARGEITLIVAGGSERQLEQEDIEELLKQGLEQGTERPSKLASRVAGLTGLPKAQIYDLLMSLKKD